MFSLELGNIRRREKERGKDRIKLLKLVEISYLTLIYQVGGSNTPQWSDMSIGGSIMHSHSFFEPIAAPCWSLAMWVSETHRKQLKKLTY